VVETLVEMEEVKKLWMNAEPEQVAITRLSLLGTRVRLKVKPRPLELVLVEGLAVVKEVAHLAMVPCGKFAILMALPV
jgi:hypothetical protein